MKMSKKWQRFLEDLLKAPSPSGCEAAASKVVQNFMAGIADKVEVDVMGNTIAILNPEKDIKIMLVGHIDQLGLQILSIDDNGFCRFNLVGGYDHNVLVGQRVVIHTQKGPIDGVLGSKAIHLMNAEERKKAADSDNMWIDIGTKNKKETEELVSIGDYATFNLVPKMLKNDTITCPGLDDKAGVYITMRTLQILSKRKKDLQVGIYAVASVQEELGARGVEPVTYRINPTVGIAIDVVHASDHPNLKKDTMNNIVIGGGPVIAKGANCSPVVVKMIEEAAKAKEINIQPRMIAGATGTDARSIQLSGKGVATALICIPNRYMHTPVETVSLKDMEEIAVMLAEFICQIKTDTSFIPW